MKKFTFTFSTAVLASALASPLAAETPPLNLDLEEVTVSGLSSGGYMATQFHIANSGWVKGAAVIAAGPYYCGQNDITTALNQCVDKMQTPLNLTTLNNQAKQWADAGLIPPLSQLEDSRVWLLHGTNDNRVNRKVVDLLHEQYKGWIASDNLEYVNDKPFAHLFPTQNSGGDCTSSESPYIGNCDYDAAGELLNHMLGELSQPDDTTSGNIISFSQAALAGENASTLGETGYAFVPKSCADGEECRVHISFHGCNQYADAVGKDYVEQTGLNRWADDNHLVVVYPQTKKSLFMPLNPQGCWDWWGYTDANYATSEGKQIQAVREIVQSLDNKEGTT